MATRLYLRNTFGNVGAFVSTEKSTALPVGTLVDGGWSARELATTKGAAQVSRVTATLAQTADQDVYLGKFISGALLVSQIDANTWTFGLSNDETNTNSNLFTMVSIYVLTAADTVRGFVTDAHTSRGVEYLATQDGQVFTVVGSLVSGVTVGDRLVFEWWCHGASSMATVYSVHHQYDGGTDVTDTTVADAASYIETPQNLTFETPFIAEPSRARTKRSIGQAIHRATSRCSKYRRRASGIFVPEEYGRIVVPETGV